MVYEAWQLAKTASYDYAHPTGASETAQDDTAPLLREATQRVQAPAFTSAPSPAEQVRRRYIDVSLLKAMNRFGAAKTQVARTSKRDTSTSGRMT